MLSNASYFLTSDLHIPSDLRRKIRIKNIKMSQWTTPSSCTELITALPRSCPYWQEINSTHLSVNQVKRLTVSRRGVSFFCERRNGSTASRIAPEHLNRTWSCQVPSLTDQTASGIFNFSQDWTFSHIFKKTWEVFNIYPIWTLPKHPVISSRFYIYYSERGFLAYWRSQLYTGPLVPHLVGLSF